MGFRLKHAWEILRNKNPTYAYDLGPSYSYRPDRTTFRPGNERTIISSIYNRIAVDVSQLSFKHVRLDQNGRYVETIDDSLNKCLTTEANEDQTGRSLIQDIVESMFDEGVVAVVPTEYSGDLFNSDSFGIRKLRTAEIIEWFPKHVRVRIYNSELGTKEDMVLPKRSVAIIENPFYSVMNSDNSAVRRLIYKLNLMDSIDEKMGSSKLDLIIQLPYVVKSQIRKDMAENRRKEIEMQLTGSKYGIAYTDGTEKITQLNRPVENNILPQIEYLTKLVFGQLSMDQSILNGTASEAVMNNYTHQTVEVVATAIVDELKRKFISKTARSQNQSILFFRDAFKLTPISQIAKIVDTFARNEILTSNEVRQIIGMLPSEDPRADELRNSNMPIDDLIPSDNASGEPEESISEDDYYRNIVNNIEGE